MKKVIAVSILMVALFSGNQIFANGNNSEPAAKSTKNLEVSFANVTMDSKLYIKDSHGQILYSENIHSAGRYNRSFDVSALPSNEYYFEVDKKAFISIYPFTKTEEMVELHDELRTEIVKPILIHDDHKVKLMRNLDQEQSLKVKVYYEGQELVYTETIEEDGKIGRIYDFSTSTSGDYLFSIDYEGRNYYQYVSIATLY